MIIFFVLLSCFALFRTGIHLALIVGRCSDRPLRVDYRARTRTAGAPGGTTSTGGELSGRHADDKAVASHSLARRAQTGHHAIRRVTQHLGIGRS